MILLPLRGEVFGDLWEVVGHHCAAGDVDHGRNRDSARVVREPGKERLLQALDAQHRVDAAGIEVEGPRPCIVRGPRHADGDDVFKAQQPADDDRSIRPRAGSRGDESVSTRLDGPLGVGIGKDSVLDVVRVPVECLALGHIAVHLAAVIGHCHLLRKVPCSSRTVPAYFRRDRNAVSRHCSQSTAERSVGIESVDVGCEVFADEVALDRLLRRQISVVFGELDGQDGELLDAFGP